MNLYRKYLAEIKKRKSEGLGPKPIESGGLLKEIINIIKTEKGPDRKSCLDYLVYNTLPGTTSAAIEKANFLKEIILGDILIKEITPSFAYELLSHMKGGPSVNVLLDMALLWCQYNQILSD